MPFNRPSLATLIDRAQADIESRLPGADARLRRSNLNVLARVVAGAAHGLYGFIVWVQRQILPDTADEEVLLRQASLYGLELKAAAAATGAVTVTGTNGTVVPAGTIFKRADGVQYSTTAEVAIAAGSAVAALSAVEPGQTGNAVAATAMTLDTPIAGIAAAATVTAAGLTGGADEEATEALRARLLARLRQPPMGGAAHDYIAWALEVPGVTRAWCYPLERGIGTVNVRFMRDDDASPIPDGAEVAVVQAYIDARRPVTADALVVAPIAHPITFTIHVVPDTSVIRAAVEEELRDLLFRNAVPGGTILLSQLDEAISLAAGETDHVLSAPAANVVPVVGHIATFGGITWA